MFWNFLLTLILVSEKSSWVGIFQVIWLLSLLLSNYWSLFGGFDSAHIVLLKESFEDFSLFLGRLGHKLRRWHRHRPFNFSNSALSDCGDYITFKEKLFDRFYQVFLHLAVIMSHSSGHYKFGGSTAVLVKLYSVWLWDQVVGLPMDKKSWTTYLLYQLNIFKPFSHDKWRQSAK